MMGNEKQLDELNHDVDDNHEKKKEEVVKFETYDKVMKRLKKVEEENRLHLQRQEEAEKQLMDEKGQYKELNAKLSEDLESEKKKNALILEKIAKSVKLAEFERALPSKLANREFLQFVKVDAIEMDGEHQVNTQSLKAEVDRFVANYPNLLEIDDEELPNTHPESNNTKGLTYDEWKNLPLKEQKARLPEMRAAEKSKGNL